MNTERYDWQATYSPEDNKLRLYYLGAGRFSDEDKERIKAAGFRWASKQELYVKPSWSVTAEDLCLELAGEIDDENVSCLERSADRAERFGHYRDKRRSEAGELADTFDAGPSAFGHQNQQRAERQAARHDRYRTKAVSQWSKAEYWQSRTEGVISHALYKSDPTVRRGRIKVLESDQRKLQKQVEAVTSKYNAWKHVLTLPDCDTVDTSRAGGDPRIVYTIQGGRGGYIGYDISKADSAVTLAFTLVNYGNSFYHCQHPRKDREGTLYSLMTDPEDPISPREAAEIYLSRSYDPSEPGTHYERWLQHYELRLTYERAMLANEGGAASDVEMIPGGWIRPRKARSLRYGKSSEGWYQICKVNKSPATGCVTSVGVLAPTTNDYDRDGNAYDENNPRPLTVHLLKVERMGEDVYRAPTPEELEAFKVSQKAQKAADKKTGAKSPSLLNPTKADAERLQALWNARGKAKHDKAKAEQRLYGEFTPATVREMTQAEYSAKSKGSYSHLETIYICENGNPRSTWEKSPVVFKIRKAYGSGNSSLTPNRVVVITDKPQKPLPLDWSAIEASIESEAVNV